MGQRVDLDLEVPRGLSASRRRNSGQRGCGKRTRGQKYRGGGTKTLRHLLYCSKGQQRCAAEYLRRNGPAHPLPTTLSAPRHAARDHREFNLRTLVATSNHKTTGRPGSSVQRLQ